MTARILVVDDLLANRILLQETLLAEYFEVVSVASGPEALEEVARQAPDLVLLDVMMPGMDGFEVCRRMKSDAALAHIPVVLVTALDQAESRLEGLEAGADDFLTKPVDTTVLVARVRNLLRTKLTIDELRQRCHGAEDGLLERLIDGETVVDAEHPAHVLLVCEDAGLSALIQRSLGEEIQLSVCAAPEEVMVVAMERPCDLVITSLFLRAMDSLRLISQLRSIQNTRATPILALMDHSSREVLPRALDLGVNDALELPLDTRELIVRVRSQIRQKVIVDRLRGAIDAALEMAVTDTLTGLYNRHFLERQLPAILSNAARLDHGVGLLMLDLDRFKSINDTYGHGAGDDVLRQFSQCLQGNLRGMDTPFRLGGEEFVVLMPDVTEDVALKVAERLRKKVEELPFVISVPPGTIQVTVSVGLALHRGPPIDLAAFLSQADDALYEAKRGGRNRVIAKAA